MRNKPTKAGLLLAIIGVIAVTAVQANTIPVAYWRHEEGPAGTDVTPIDDSVLDASGNGNHMRTWSVDTAATYTSMVSPKPLRSGLPNTLSLDFTPNRDNYAPGKPINAHVFNAMTIELAFNMDSVGENQWQALLGKDGNPIAAQPPLAVKVRGDSWPNDIANQLQVEFLDGDSEPISLASGLTIQPGEWYHLAAVITATNADMYLAVGAGDYQLVDSLTGDFAGPNGEVLIDLEGTFTIGRGMWNGGLADWADGLIDEVRISDVALPPDQFLFIPEPSTGVALLLLGLVATRGRRRS